MHTVADHAGNVYLTGWFGSLFGPTAVAFGTDTLFTPSQDYFLLKLRPTGQRHWLVQGRQLSQYASGNRFPQRLVVGADDDVFMTGFAYPGIDSIRFGNITLPTNGIHQSIFVARFAAADGQTRWARMPRTQPGQGSGVVSTIEAHDIRADAEGHLYVIGRGTGFRWDGVYVDNGVHDTRFFWLKLDADGRHLTHRLIREPSRLGAGGPVAMAVDRAGYSYLLLHDFDTITISRPPTVPPFHLGSSADSVMLVKLDPVGHVEWSRRLMSTNGSIEVDATGTIYLAHSYHRTLTLDGLTVPASPFPNANGALLLLDGTTGRARQILTLTGRGDEDLMLTNVNAQGKACFAGASSSDSTLVGSLLLYGWAGQSGKSIIGRIGSDYNLLHGAAYADTNLNGVHDPDERAYFFGSVLRVLPGGNCFVADERGFYEATVARGTFGIELADPPRYHHVVATGPTATPFASYGNRMPGRSFALQPIPGQQDVQVFLTYYDDPGAYGLSYRNIGTVPIATGSVTLAYDSLLVYYASSQAPTSHANRLLTWNYADLLPGQARHLNVRFTGGPTTQPLDTIRAYATAYPLVGDLTPADNRDSVRWVVPNSPEPPVGTHVGFRSLSLAQVRAGQWLDYTVRFRNVLPDSAYSVVLRDSLPTWRVRVPSLEVVGASQPFTWTLERGNVLTIRLTANRLAPATASSAGGSGYVRFRVRPADTLVLGDEIRNRASICFNQAPPMLTDWAITRVEAAAPLGVASAVAPLPMYIWPNPTSEQLTIETQLPKKSDLTVQLLDGTGRVVRQRHSPAVPGRWQQRLNVADVAPGLYLIRLQAGGQQSSRLVVISH